MEKTTLAEISIGLTALSTFILTLYVTISTVFYIQNKKRIKGTYGMSWVEHTLLNPGTILFAIPIVIMTILFVASYTGKLLMGE